MLLNNSTSPALDLATLLGPDPLTDGLRDKLAEMIRMLLDAELDTRLEAARYVRTQSRSGYRNGKKSRTVSTSLGCVEIESPRARLYGSNGKSTEWESELLPKYKRRTIAVDAALLGVYLSGTNTRRVARALKPLLGDAPISKSVISRLVPRLKQYVEEWKSRDLSKQNYVYLYLDATNLKVRILSKVRRVPILVALGVRQDGSKDVVAMVPLIKESEAAWEEVLRDLVERKIGRPRLVIVDGHKGLRNAVEITWPEVPVQRCTVHKLMNLAAKCPLDVYPELKADYNEIIRAEGLEQARVAYQRFVKKWKGLANIIRSLDEAGDELLTFYRFPKEQWKSLRTTNPIERLNLEFKRRVKTQCSLPSQDSAVTLLFGLILSGQIRFRKISGFQSIKEVTNSKEEQLQKCAS